MKKLALFICIVVTLSSFPAPSFALDFETEKPCEFNSAIDQNDPNCSENQIEKIEKNDKKINIIESSRALIISEIAPRICPNENKNCDNETAKTGAFIEIYNEADLDFTLENWKIQYAAISNDNSPGKWSNIANIETDLAAKSYLSFNVAVSNKDSGYLQILDENDEIIDIVSYGKITELAFNVAPKIPINESAQRCELLNGSLNDFKLYDIPTPGFGSSCSQTDENENEENENENESPKPANTCEGLMLSEIGANLDAQFIEMQNTNDSDLNIKDCRLMTNRSNTKFFAFENETLAPNAFKIINISETDLTLTKTTKGTVYLLNSEGSNETDSVNYENLKQNTSYAKINGVWRQTYAMTPGNLNLMQEFPACDDGYFRNLETGKCNKIIEPATLKACEEGYFRNPETGRCKKITIENALAPCPEGQYRNPETNRCRKISSSETALTPCKEGYERNPETNRCRKIVAQTNELAPCKEGYERNPETNRCRKIVSSAAATFALNDQANSENENFSWFMIMIGIVSFITIVIFWQFRGEILRGLNRLKLQKSGEE